MTLLTYKPFIANLPHQPSKKKKTSQDLNHMHREEDAAAGLAGVYVGKQFKRIMLEWFGQRKPIKQVESLLTGPMPFSRLCMGIALETLAGLDQNHAGECASNVTVLDNCMPVFKNMLWFLLIYKHSHGLFDLTRVLPREWQSTLDLGQVLN